MPAIYLTIPQRDDGQRLDRWIRQKYPSMPFSQIQKSCRTGEIRLDRGRVKGQERLKAGQELRLPPQFQGKEASVDIPVLTSAEKDFIRSTEISRDENIIVINKPSGLATQGGHKITQHVDHLARGLVDLETEEPPRLVHRLDKDTSGVLVLARDRDTATQMMKAFQRRDVEKIYLAIVVGSPKAKSGVIDAPLKKQKTDDGDRVLVDPTGDEAISHYQVLDKTPNQSHTLVALFPKTGRQHQLRAHCHHLGTPIYGDEKYNAVHDAERLFLHAYQITVPLAERSFKAELPESFLTALERLGLEFDPNLVNT